MATISLGLQPFDMVVTLPSDANFVSTLVNADGWDPAVQIELRLVPATGMPIVWPATISGINASWDVPAVDVATALVAAPKLVRLHYTDADGVELLWGKGRVNVA